MTDDDVELPEEVQESFQQAQQIQQQLDQFKAWAGDRSREIRTRADVLEEVGEIDEAEADQRRQVASLVSTIYERIEYGDSNQAKQGNAN